MNINYIKQHCTDLSHDDTIRKKYYRKRFNSLFYIMLGVLFIGVVGMGVMAILSISHNKDYNLIGISCLLPAAFWGVICLHQYAKYDLIIIKQYYREHITQRLINGNWFQRQKEIDRIFFEIKRKHKNTLIKTLKLSFEWEDIRYIVVKRKQDIKTISELLQNLAPDIHPQIFTTQQILEDVIGCNHNRQLSISDAK